MKYAMLQLNKETHVLLKSYCEEHGFKMSSLVDKLIKKHIGISNSDMNVLRADKIKKQSY
jgi:hypothetical protein